MTIPTDAKQLEALFERLGASDPAEWAASQVDEGMPQLHRFLFLRQAWSQVIDEDDHRWMDRHIAAAKAEPAEPFSGIGLALERLLAAGVSRDDLADLVRGMQAELLFGLCHLLDAPSLEEPGLDDVGWTLVTTDERQQPTDRTMGGLHESVLETDPSGREMCPRTTP